MLFGYVNPPDKKYKDDVMVTEFPITCLNFDNNPLYTNELYIAGTLAFISIFELEEHLDLEPQDLYDNQDQV